MYISEYMTVNPITISPEACLPEARAILDKYRFRHLPVVDSDGVLVGIVTDRDLRSAYPSSVARGEQLLISQKQVDETKLSEIMVTDYTYISPQDTLDDSLLVFDKIRVGALPVLDRQRKILGMFSIRDLTSAYKKLFGMAEKGSVLIAVEDKGNENCMSSILVLLEQQQIPVTRLIRIPGTEQENGRIYMRINTFKISKVNKLLADAGFTLIKPEHL